jgi:hypothetical protein
VVIQIQFQNLPSANNEILKAFNSQNAAKALEAYQPLSIKERKREKLRALQLLKQTSYSATLADISLGSDTLALALARAEGATLQAMLNLLSAKMIEQNKYMAYAQAKAEQERREAEEKAKLEVAAIAQEEQDQQKEDEQAEQLVAELEKQRRDYVQELLVTATDYLNQLRAEVNKVYARVLDAVSLEHIQEYIEHSIKTIRKYVYEMPLENFNEHVLEPLREMPIKVKKFIDIKIKSALEQDIKTTFSADEIKAILNRSMQNRSRSIKLEKTISTMDQSLRAYNAKQAQQQVAQTARKDLKLALHNV